MIYNCHTHTHLSHDSNADPADLCRQCVKDNVNGLLLSDHCDCEYADAVNYNALFQQGEREAVQLRQRFGASLKIHFGIELGDPLFSEGFAKNITAAFPFDAILISVHAVRFSGYEIPFSQIDFSNKSDLFISEYLSQYFNDVLCTIQEFDHFDTLCHLTVPLRYIILKYGRHVDISSYYPIIAQILTILIQKRKSLEINTSALSLNNGFLMPDQYIAAMFITMGGRFFTIGSDAHVPTRVSFGLRNAAHMLKDLGIKEACYYEQRNRIFYSL